MGDARGPTTDAMEILHRRYIEGNPEASALLEEARADAQVARLIRDLREGAGLSQEQLASRIGTPAPVIDRLEEADHEGHSLAMLRRVVDALGMDIEIRAVSRELRGENPGRRVDKTILPISLTNGEA